MAPPARAIDYDSLRSLQEEYTEYHKNVQDLVERATEAGRLKDERSLDKAQAHVDAAAQQNLLRKALGERKAAAAAAADKADNASAAGDSAPGDSRSGSTRKNMNRCECATRPVGRHL